MTDSSPRGPSGDTRAHDTRAATRGRRARPDRRRIPAGRSAEGAGKGQDGHPRGMFAHRHAPVYRQTAQSRGTEPWPEPCGPIQGDGGTSEHRAPSRHGWAPGCPHPAANAIRKEGGGIPWGSIWLPSHGPRVVAWAGRHAQSAFPGLGGDAVATLGGN